MTNSHNRFERIIRDELESSIAVKRQVINDQISVVNDLLELVIQRLGEGKKIVLFGNGGSAADSQHIAAELVCRYRRDRRAFRAIALTTDTSNLTSIANDFGLEYIFSRQIEAIGQEGDVAIGISTSGKSLNVLNGIKTAREKGLTTVGITGEDGGNLRLIVDICIQIPSKNTARIQEAYMTVAHAMCEVIEQECFTGDA